MKKENKICLPHSHGEGSPTVDIRLAYAVPPEEPHAFSKSKERLFGPDKRMNPFRVAVEASAQCFGKGLGLITGFTSERIHNPLDGWDTGKQTKGTLRDRRAQPRISTWRVQLTNPYAEGDPVPRGCWWVIRGGLACNGPVSVGAGRKSRLKGTGVVVEIGRFDVSGMQRGRERKAGWGRALLA